MKPILVFQTDFTYKEGAVCAMYGVVKSVDRTLEIIDGTHDIPKYDIWSGSYRLFQSMKFWPKGTIFVSVVDPGVGTKRRACVAKTSDGYFVVTPDNGSLTHLVKYTGIEKVREIDESVNRLKGKDTEGVSVFHGRDLFGYCAARLASGIITYEEVGPRYPVEEIVKLPMQEPTIKEGHAQGVLEIGDPNFGNVWSNIDLKDFNRAGFHYGDTVRVKITCGNDIRFEESLLFERSFGYVNKGEPVIYNNELMKIALAVNQDSFAEKYAIEYGPEWIVEFCEG